tara:strand:- start:4059 stop:5108 length:1050 start_codon:yes stop_codon:yes gene_type:complete
MEQFFSDVISDPIAKTAILVFLSLLFAKIADILFSFLIKKVVLKTKSNIDDKIVNFLHKPIYYSILFVCLSLTIELSNQIPEGIEYILIGLFKSISIALWSFALFNIFILLIKWYSTGNQENKLFSKNALPLFDNLGKIIIFLGSIYFILLSWDVDVTGWVASAGILSVILGLGAKDTVANLFAGIFIMADAPYKEGDYINLDSGERGCVKSIGIRSTRIMTRDDIEITIPNSVIANSKIINESGGPHEKERVRLNISVSYDSDIDKVREVLFDLAINSEYSCKDPKPRIRFREFGDSGLKFQLLFWIEKPELRGASIDNISSAIHKEFKKQNIEIPYPQHTIHMKKNI